MVLGIQERLLSRVAVDSWLSGLVVDVVEGSEDWSRIVVQADTARELATWTRRRREVTVRCKLMAGKRVNAVMSYNENTTAKWKGLSLPRGREREERR